MTQPDLNIQRILLHWNSGHYEKLDRLDLITLLDYYDEILNVAKEQTKKVVD